MEPRRLIGDININVKLWSKTYTFVLLQEFWTCARLGGNLFNLLHSELISYKRW